MSDGVKSNLACIVMDLQEGEVEGLDLGFRRYPISYVRDAPKTRVGICSRHVKRVVTAFRPHYDRILLAFLLFDCNA